MKWELAEAAGVDIRSGHTPGQEQVRRMAENDEPKCKNCSWWQRIADDKTVGLCALNQSLVAKSVSVLSAGSMPDKWHFHETTDLSLCSAWEPKE